MDIASILKQTGAIGQVAQQLGVNEQVAEAGAAAFLAELGGQRGEDFGGDVLKRFERVVHDATILLFNYMILMINNFMPARAQSLPQIFSQPRWARRC